MQKSIPISILLFFVLSCKNSHKTHPVQADTLTAPHQTIKDTPLNEPTTQKSFPKSTNITMVVEKMDNRATIGEVDFEIIDQVENYYQQKFQDMSQEYFTSEVIFLQTSKHEITSNM